MDDGTVLAKKPYKGWSCASCDKEIPHLHTKQSEYFPWSKMPLRDPTDRIQRAGQGFSRMLATVKPEYLAKTMNASQRAMTEESDNEEGMMQEK